VSLTESVEWTVRKSREDEVLEITSMAGSVPGFEKGGGQMELNFRKTTSTL
jgi:hypothetical protein